AQHISPCCSRFSQGPGSAHGARVSSDGANGMGALSLWLFFVPGLRDCAFHPDRFRVVARSVDPVLSRLVTRHVLAPVEDGMQNSDSSGSARRPVVCFVSANHNWLPL